MIRNYRQIAKTGSQVAFIGVGKTQGGKQQLGDPTLFIKRIPIPIQPIGKYTAPVPYMTYTIEKH